MPIIINDNNTVTQVNVKGGAKKSTNVFSPSFFNKTILTGRGGTSRGLLNENVDPKNHINGYASKINPNLEASTMYNGNSTIYNIPFYMIYPNAWSDYISKFNRPDINDMTKIAQKGNTEVYLTMPIHAVQIDEVKNQSYVNGMPSGSPVITKTLSACFHMFLFAVNDPSNNEHKQVSGMGNLSNSKENVFYRNISYNMFETLRETESTLTKNGFIVDKYAMNDFFQNYSLYIEISKASERWNTQTDYFIADVLAKNAKDYARAISYSDPWMDKYGVGACIGRLDKYSVPLQLFQTMYQKLKSYTTPDILTSICKMHLNLMLSDTLQHMNANKSNLKYCPDTNKSMLTNCPSGQPYSYEQKAAIASTSPLTMVQSGAGTGKSTIILGRIQHMIANGIKPEDILVLSFTNNAANHILDQNPNINSMTIDRMMRLIYAENYPTHQLSSISTIINSLDIYFNPINTNSKKTQFIEKFKRILQRLRDDMEYTKAMNFVENNLDEVISVLNTIEQTSLELQSIICYLKMDTLVEPAETQADHLIIDEVQDNSISQFVYSIKYTDKHMCSMYIVGDCSQTLYEFRASNPKALNVLEGSGVFETYKLQTNYRSNQEILDFANIGLSNIEANQYAKIQLQANSLKPVTLQSFKDAVNFHYERMKNKSKGAWDSLFATSISVIKSYVDDKLMKGEQVTFLARRRSDIRAIESNLMNCFSMVPAIDHSTGKVLVDDKGNVIKTPVKIASLIPKRQYDNTILSKFISQYWNTIRYAPPTDILTIIETELVAQAPYLSYKRNNAQLMQQMAQATMAEFRQRYGEKIKSLQANVIASVITSAEMLDEIKKYMISFEIERNGIAQAVMSSRNNENKSAEKIAGANFILSTIHSAKGLEFDNVVIYYDSESESKIDEATKRMYYVALTRAKKTEFIFAYDTMAKPKIGNDYDRIIKDLTTITASGNASADDDSDNNDDD